MPSSLGLLLPLSSLVSLQVCMGASTFIPLVLASSTPLTSATSQPRLSTGSLSSLGITPVFQSQSGMILSPAADPIPHTLVQRIQSGQFVDMRDMLAQRDPLLVLCSAVKWFLLNFSRYPLPPIRYTQMPQDLLAMMHSLPTQVCGFSSSGQKSGTTQVSLPRNLFPLLWSL